MGLPRKGKAFVAELRELYKVGRHTYVEVATAYSAANGGLAGSGDKESKGFPSTYIGGAGNPVSRGAIFEPWTALRDELQTLTKEGRDNFLATGAALVRAAEHYAEADTSNAEPFEEAKRKLGDEPKLPPPAVGPQE